MAPPPNHALMLNVGERGPGSGIKDVAHTHTQAHKQALRHILEVHLYIHTYRHVHILMYVCMCVHVQLMAKRKHAHRRMRHTCIERLARQFREALGDTHL